MHEWHVLCVVSPIYIFWILYHHIVVLSMGLCHQWNLYATPILLRMDLLFFDWSSLVLHCIYIKLNIQDVQLHRIEE